MTGQLPERSFLIVIFAALHRFIGPTPRVVFLPIRAAVGASARAAVRASPPPAPDVDSMLPALTPVSIPAAALEARLAGVPKRWGAGARAAKPWVEVCVAPPPKAALQLSSPDALDCG